MDISFDTVAVFQYSTHPLLQVSCSPGNQHPCHPTRRGLYRENRSLDAFESQELLGFILKYLDMCRNEGLLNNSGIPRMVRNYFKELTVVIFECARLLKPGAPFVMVNDNVRYQGINIPVDLILSEIAQQAGFETQVIWVLPIGKGNSSHQMRTHGREELRKCVYVWSHQKDTSHSAKSETC